MDILAMIQAVPGVGPYLPYVLILFGICAVAAAQLPPPQRASSLYGAVYRCVNLLGQNYNYARNAVADGGRPGTAPSATAAIALAVALAVPLCLGACSGSGSNASGDVAALEASLTAAESLATAYVQLPGCTGTNGPLCADSAIVSQIKAADNQAYSLVKAAEQAAGDPSALSAAQTAVAALNAIVIALPKQGH